MRDLTIINILGFTAKSDQIFLGMTIAMFAQLVGYNFGLNIFMGYSGRIWQYYFGIPVFALSIVITAIFIYVTSIFDANILLFFHSNLFADYLKLKNQSYGLSCLICLWFLAN